MTTNNYIFCSERLGFRNWTQADIPLLSAINADPEVMEFFPATQTELQTISFIERMKLHYAENSFCYFAVETLDNKKFIGFIGLCHRRR